MRKDFCDRCGEHIENMTMDNRIALPDHTSADFCSGCTSSLRELVRKWKATLRRNDAA